MKSLLCTPDIDAKEMFLRLRALEKPPGFASDDSCDDVCVVKAITRVSAAVLSRCLGDSSPRLRKKTFTKVEDVKTASRYNRKPECPFVWDIRVVRAPHHRSIKFRPLLRRRSLNEVGNDVFCRLAPAPQGNCLAGAHQVGLPLPSAGDNSCGV